MVAQQTTLTIAFLGLQPRDRQLFESFLGILEGRTDTHLHICDTCQSVDVLVVDSTALTHPPAAELSRARTVISYGEEDARSDDAFSRLTKPVRFWDLQALLTSLCKETAPPPQVKPPQNTDKRPRRLYKLLEQVDRSKPIAIRFGELTLFTDPENGRYYYPDKLDDLDPLCRALEEKLSITPANATALEQEAQGMRSSALVRLWWEIAIIGSQGMLPAPLTLDTPVSLQRWPDLGALNFRDHYPVLCAQLSRRNTTASAMSQRSSVAISDVASFLSACDFCGYLKVSESTPTTVSDATRTISDPGLISRIKKRLGLSLGFSMTGHER